MQPLTSAAVAINAGNNHQRIIARTFVAVMMHSDVEAVRLPCATVVMLGECQKVEPRDVARVCKSLLRNSTTVAVTRVAMQVAEEGLQVA